MNKKITNIRYDYNDTICITADVQHADGTTTQALEWIVEGELANNDTHLFTCQSNDFTDEEIREIIAAFEAFIAEKPTPEFMTMWTSKDGRAELTGFECAKENLDAELEAWKAELLAQCTDDEERNGIMDGKFIISHPAVTFEVRHLR